MRKGEYCVHIILYIAVLGHYFGRVRVGVRGGGKCYIIM